MTVLEQLRAIRPRHLRQAPGFAYHEARAAWLRTIPRRTVIWGGRLGDRWIGTAEDLALAEGQRRAAERQRCAAERLRRRTAALVALGRMGKSLDDAIAEQGQLIARVTINAGDFARAMRRTGEALERAQSRNAMFGAEFKRREAAARRRGLR